MLTQTRGRRFGRLIGAAAATMSALLVGSLLIAAPAATAQTKPRPVVTGWFGWWASDASVTALATQNEGVIDEVNMFWWAFAGAKNPLCTYDNGDYNNNGQWGDCLTGSSTPWTTPKFDRQRQILQNAGVRIQASITDLSPTQGGALSSYLSTSKRRQAYVKQIVDWAVKAGVDGVDLDMENFAFRDGRDSWAATKPRWVAFVKLLGKKLHEKNLTLSATVPGGVPPFQSNGQPNPGTGYWVYAWDEIISSVDRLIIMAYDYSYTVPGPIGPNNWASEVARSAVAQVGEQYSTRVWIGAPQYGRNWIRRDGSAYVTAKDCPTGWTPNADQVRLTVTPERALTLAAREKIEPTWNGTFGEWSFRYDSPTPGRAGGKAVTCTAKREVWFADTRSALARASVVPTLQIGGIGVWDFGTVQPDFYPKLAAYGREIAPVATKVSIAAPKTVGYGRNVRIDVTTSSTAGPAADATATLRWRASGSSATPARVAEIALDPRGRGSFVVPAEATGEWSVQVSGSWARRSATSAPATTRVRWLVDRSASTTEPLVRQSVTLTASVQPATEGVTLRLQRKAAKGWTTVRTLTTDAAGSVTTSVRATSAKKVVFRFVAAGKDGYVAGNSKAITLDVQPR